jgi:hypothetical protein
MSEPTPSVSDVIEVVVPNMAEFNARAFASGLDPAATRGFAAVGNKWADQCVFWTANPRVLVMPEGMDRLWFGDVHRALGLREPAAVFPELRSGLLLADLLADGRALAELREMVAGRRQIRIISWGATVGLYRLAAVLRSWGVEAVTDGPAEPELWTSSYLDSKMSCVDFGARIPGFRVPRGLTVGCWDELRGALTAIVNDSGFAIVKSLHGVGGEGSFVVNGLQGLDAFWHITGRDVFFRSFPLSVQEYVERTPDMGCPAVDLRVTAHGVESVTLSMMTVHQIHYQNVSVGEESVPEAERGRLTALATAVGEAARDLGYRGWLCIDCLVDTAGELYVTELNARRSGAMHSIALMRYLASGAEPVLTAHSDDFIPVAGPRGAVSYADHVRPVFERLWEDGVRAYPTSVRGLRQLRPEISAVAVAATVAEARSAITAIRTALAHPREHRATVEHAQ